MPAQHTITRISSITLDRVSARMHQADQRVRAARKDMSDRCYRRSMAPTCPTDLVSPTLPALPRIPDAVRAVYRSEDIAYWIAVQDYPNHVDSILRLGTETVREDVTAEALVAAIHAADAHAVACETLCAQYRQTVADAVAAHVATSVDAVRELAGLVGQTA